MVRIRSILKREILKRKSFFFLGNFLFFAFYLVKKNGTSHPGQPTNLLCPFLVPQCSTYLPTQNRDVINGCSLNNFTPLFNFCWILVCFKSSSSIFRMSKKQKKNSYKRTLHYNPFSIPELSELPLLFAT